MKQIILSLFLILGITACSSDPTPSPTPPAPEENLFNISVLENKLSAYSVNFNIIPSDPNTRFYCDVISKARLSTIDIAALKADLIATAERSAEFTGTTVDEALSSILSIGTQLDVCNNAGYRPQTEFTIFAFYWDGPNQDKLTLCDFTTPAAEPSKENVSIETLTCNEYSMTLKVSPTSGVTEYWYYFNETSKVDSMLSELEDENAYISYQAMNVGTNYKGVQTLEHKGLKSNTEYTALVMAIDNKLNRLLVEQVLWTDDKGSVERVESQLFESLCGEWNGVQNISDGINDPFENEFTVTICQKLDDYDYDYRAQNQLVAKVDGWCNQKYYGVNDLKAQEGVADPEGKFGPKWLFNIAQGDKISLDGKAHYSTFGWHFVGDCYMLNMNMPAGGGLPAINVETDFVVTLSEDGNTLTISSPEELSGYYPSMGYEFTGYGWQCLYVGHSDITLTRK